jgi:superoxide reductase
MTNKLELYKCNICGNLVEVVLSGVGTLVCCGEDMEKLAPKTFDEKAEKHVPVIEVKDEEVTIRVGQVPHPMEEAHYIQFIEAISEDNNYIKRKYLKPGDEPELKFKCNCSKLSARELCNIHGLWASNN